MKSDLSELAPGEVTASLPVELRADAAAIAETVDEVFGEGNGTL